MQWTKNSLYIKKPLKNYGTFIQIPSLICHPNLHFGNLQEFLSSMQYWTFALPFGNGLVIRKTLQIQKM
jgi:hypothetical protein